MWKFLTKDYESSPKKNFSRHILNNLYYKNISKHINKNISKQRKTKFLAIKNISKHILINLDYKHISKQRKTKLLAIKKHFETHFK